MATKKEIMDDLKEMGVTLENRDYGHAELMDLLKKTKAIAAADDQITDPAVTDDNAPGEDDLDEEETCIDPGDDDDNDEDDDSDADEEEKPKYAFPTKSRCPRCQGAQTKAVSTQGKIQYRKCLAPICLKNFTVKGTKI